MARTPAPGAHGHSGPFHHRGGSQRAVPNLSKSEYTTLKKKNLTTKSKRLIREPSHYARSRRTHSSVLGAAGLLQAAGLRKEAGGSPGRDQPAGVCASELERLAAVSSEDKGLKRFSA